jgi:hypothetical protein
MAIKGEGHHISKGLAIYRVNNNKIDKVTLKYISSS